jgi:uncharacterized protein DUF3224
MSILWKILTGRAAAQDQSKDTHFRWSTVAGVCLVFGFCCVAYARTGLQVPSPTKVSGTARASGTTTETKTVTTHISGAFDVKITPQKPDNKEAESANFGRMSIDKQFHGDLDATSKGEMLSILSDAKDAGGYVALERVTGTLRGRSGTFALQHNGTMSRGTFELSVTVVPESGTGQLVGLAGKMTIRIVEGKHFYDFDYTLPETP